MDTTNKETQLETITQTLTQSGTGNGVSMHFPSRIATKYGLSPDTEVTVNIVHTENGTEIKIKDLPTGFSKQDLETHAKKHDWTQQDTYDDSRNTNSQNWSRTYTDSTGAITIAIDNPVTMNQSPDVLNNVFITSEPIPITNINDYIEIKDAITTEDFRLTVIDNNGVWTQLQQAMPDGTDTPPQPEVVTMLLDQTDSVAVQLKFVTASPETTLDRIHEIVTEMKEFHSFNKDVAFSQK